MKLRRVARLGEWGGGAGDGDGDGWVGGEMEALRRGEERWERGRGSRREALAILTILIRDTEIDTCFAVFPYLPPREWPVRMILAFELPLSSTKLVTAGMMVAYKALAAS